MSMIYKLKTLPKYTKKKAKKRNKYFSFNPASDSIEINQKNFQITSLDVKIVTSKRAFRKAHTSDSKLIYYSRKGLLFFNENGAKKGFGDGGTVALFRKRVVLNADNFELTSGPSAVPTPTPVPAPSPVPAPATDAVFPRGPRPTEISSENFSGAIGVGEEIDRFSISSSVGDVLSLSVDAADGTWPLVRLVDGVGRVLDSSTAYDDNSASTSGYRVDGDALFAEVYTQLSYTGSYNLQVERFHADAPLRSIPQDLLILLDQNAMDSADQYASRYLFPAPAHGPGRGRGA
jgi:hypothetical protein